MRIKLFTNTYTESLVKIIKTYTKASTTIHTPYCTLTTNTISLSYSNTNANTTNIPLYCDY